MGTTVEALHDTLEQLATVDLDTLTDGEQDAELVAFVRAKHRLDAELARRAARWDRSGVWRSDGSRAPWARLSRTTGLAPSAARRILRHGRDLARMPFTAQAWTAGELGADHVDLLAGAAGGGRHELFARDETVLVAQCGELTFAQVVKAVRYWCLRADAELDHDGTPPPNPGSLGLHTGFDGTVTGEFTLDPIAGATVTEALRRIERHLYREDQRDGVIRTMSERMAAALVEMAIRANTAPVDGRRPEPLICILAGEATLDQLCELATGTVIHPRPDRPPPRPLPGADVHLRRRRPGHRRIEAAHLPGDAAPRRAGPRPALPTPLRLRRPDHPLRRQPPHPPPPTAASPPKPTATSNANPTTANPTSTAVNPPTPSTPPANADNSTTSPANDSKP